MLLEVVGPSNDWPSFGSDLLLILLWAQSVSRHQSRRSLANELSRVTDYL